MSNSKTKNRQTNLIEFIGLPGSGKSTLRDHVVEILRENSEAAYGLNEGYYCSLSRNIQIPHEYILTSEYVSKIAYQVLNFYDRYNKISHSSLTRFLVNWSELISLVYSHLSTNTPSKERSELYSKWVTDFLAKFALCLEQLYDTETLVLDEGFANRSLTLFHYQSDSTLADIEYYANKIPVPEVLIIPNVSPQTAINRMSQRKRGYPPAFKNISNDKRINIQNNIKKVVEAVSDVLQKRGSKVFYVDNSDDIKSTISTIEESII